jgi:hypothetical protein
MTEEMVYLDETSNPKIGFRAYKGFHGLVEMADSASLCGNKGCPDKSR